MAGITSVEDRIRQEYSILMDNFTNLVKSSKLQDPVQHQTQAPGEMLEVFAEKMLAACRALLAITAELKRSALLNDVQARNAEVREAISLQLNSLATQQQVVEPMDDVAMAVAAEAGGEESDISIM